MLERGLLDMHNWEVWSVIKFAPSLCLLRYYVCSVIMFAPLLCLLCYYVCSVTIFAPLLCYNVFSKTVLIMDCFEKREIQKTITFFQYTKVETTKGNCSEMYWKAAPLSYATLHKWNCVWKSQCVWPMHTSSNRLQFD